MGNHHLAVLMPHGNSKKAINFLTTASSVRSAIVESKNYKEMLIDVKDEPIQFQPRNPRQFKYIRSVESAGKRLGIDSFVTLHELAYMMPGFVWTISTYPDLAVSFGIQKSIEQLVMCSQVFLSYDTTFNLGDFYLSILVAQMSYFVEKPCMPIAFLLHDRKFDIVHKFSFQNSQNETPNFK
ncbi:uncharacterized protein LOC136084428 [Hydra vulgaris]|uniref:Uncharacterized protein LOC136084428 n=1 Tax=Hydra vulgaris TaxID=6087 RepID=A0ABM4CFK1_HYDVU